MSRKTRQALRAELFTDDPRCTYCRREITRFDESTLDHVHPVSRGGRNYRRNLALCCEVCNQHKANLTLTEWSDVLATMLQSARQLEGSAAA